MTLDYLGRDIKMTFFTNVSSDTYDVEFTEIVDMETVDLLTVWLGFDDPDSAMHIMIHRPGGLPVPFVEWAVAQARNRLTNPVGNDSGDR